MRPENSSVISGTAAPAANEEKSTCAVTFSANKKTISGYIIEDYVAIQDQLILFIPKNLEAGRLRKLEVDDLIRLDEDEDEAWQAMGQRELVVYDLSKQQVINKIKGEYIAAYVIDKNEILVSFFNNRSGHVRYFQRYRIPSLEPVGNQFQVWGCYSEVISQRIVDRELYFTRTSQEMIAYHVDNDTQRMLHIYHKNGVQVLSNKFIFFHANYPWDPCLVSVAALDYEGKKERQMRVTGQQPPLSEITFNNHEGYDARHISEFGDIFVVYYQGLNDEGGKTYLDFYTMNDRQFIKSVFVPHVLTESLVLLSDRRTYVAGVKVASATDDKGWVMREVCLIDLVDQRITCVELGDEQDAYVGLEALTEGRLLVIYEQGVKEIQFNLAPQYNLTLPASDTNEAKQFTESFSREQINLFSTFSLSPAASLPIEPNEQTPPRQKWCYIL